MGLPIRRAGRARGGSAGSPVSVRSEPLQRGPLDIAVNEKSELWSGYRMARFVAVEKFQVRGFLNRYRQAGIGAPLAAELEAAGQGPEAEAARKRIPPRLKVPVTAVLRLDNVAEGIASGRIQGEI